MAVAIRHGYSWPTMCNGDGECSLCWTTVLAGGDNLSELNCKEQEGLNLLPRAIREGPVRLACQARLLGDVTVKKKGVRKAAG